MKTMIYSVLKNYNTLAADAAYTGRFPNNQPGANIDLLQQRMAMVQSWLQLLNADELFVIQKHLIEGIDWARVTHLYTEYWDGQFTRCEKTLYNYQASALMKIEEFCNKHIDSVEHLFGQQLDDLQQNSASAERA